MLGKRFKALYLIFFIFNLLHLSSPSNSQNTLQEDIVVCNSASSSIEIGEHFYIFKDDESKFNIGQANSMSFYHSNSKVPNLGISKATFWVRFHVKNLTGEKLVLAIDYPVLDHITLYQVSGTKIDSTSLGEVYKYKNRFFDHQNYIFNLKETDKNTPITYYLKVRSGEQIQLPVYVGSSKSIFEKLLLKDMIAGIYFGIILVMIFYNLFVYFSVRDKNYLYYVLYILMLGMTQATLQGYAFKYLWPNSEWMALQSGLLFPCFVGIAALLFIKNFLNTSKHVPKLDKVIDIVIGVYLISIILSLVNRFDISQFLIQIAAIIGSFLTLFTAAIISAKGIRTAKFFLIAWSIFLLGVFIFVLKDFGVLPYNNLTYYTMQAGSALEVILLSFALADRINVFKKEKEESQEAAMTALRDKEKLIVEQNVNLEKKVKERTYELQEANEELNVTLNYLKETQSKLVESEKMASLGQLTAGIAHEINNPINFVSSSVTPLKRDIKFLMELLDKYQLASEPLELKDRFADIRKYETKLDLPYLKEEIQTILAGITDGATRTSEIVKGLKNFSRLDESDLKLADINDGISSTLLLLNNKLDGICVKKSYGALPLVECFAGKINQVFMNILSNSIHAVENIKNERNPEIVITTAMQENNVIICFKDNGTGIPEEIKNKIFNPFFTTKDVGEGTGLGLSIVYNIIQNHNGDIEMKSKLGTGTEFIITLPKSHKV